MCGRAEPGLRKPGTGAARFLSQPGAGPDATCHCGLIDRTGPEPNSRRCALSPGRGQLRAWRIPHPCHLLSSVDAPPEHDPDWPPGVHMVRGIMSVPHVLVDAGGAVLLDTGFPGDAGRIKRVMAKAGVGPRDVRAILLTHGHIDHAGNAAMLKAWTGAGIYAHPLEEEHVAGMYPYSGFARLTGWLEAAGRAVTRYRPVTIDHRLNDGDELPFWGGLRVVHLPGHTDGHCGFYSARHQLLFSGDLWVRFLMRTQTSPRIFSDNVAQVPGSMLKAQSFRARWVVPGHYDLPNATWLRRRFEELCDEIARREKLAV
jgi:glyoxylase-like metal-dependent hydrolase (beta-lactamase superfamily II)